MDMPINKAIGRMVTTSQRKRIVQCILSGKTSYEIKQYPVSKRICRKKNLITGKGRGYLNRRNGLRKVIYSLFEAVVSFLFFSINWMRLDECDY